MFTRGIDTILAAITPVGNATIPTLLEVCVKGSFILLVAWALAFLLRRSSASLRHQVWFTALLILLLLPLLPNVELATAPLLERPATTRDLPVPPASPTDVSSARVASGREDQESDLQTIEPISTTVSSGELADARLRQLPRKRWRELAFLLWLTGAGLAGTRYAISHMKLYRVLRRATPAAGRGWADSVPAAKTALGYERDVSVLTTRDTVVPLAWGKHVVFPDNANSWPKQRRELVLIHEIAHVQRRDHIGILVAQTACCVYWLNPLVWLSAKKLRTEQEGAADDKVVAMGVRPSDYARALLAVASQLPRASRATQPTILRRSMLEERLRDILDKSRARRAPSRRTAIAMSSSLALLSIVVASVSLSAAPPMQNESGATSVSVLGSVEDELGEPIEGATVLFTTRGGFSQTQTDSSGQFRATFEEEIPYQLYVTASGFAPWTKQRLDPNELVVAVLAPGRALEGVVRDARTGDPVQGALVSTLGIGGTTRPIWIEPGPGVVEGRTNEKGQFRLDGLARGPRKLWVVARGYDQAEVDVRSDEPSEVVLRPGSGIVGLVRDSAGEPISGATVRPIAQAGGPSPWPSLRSTVKTADDGEFELLGLRPGRYRVMLSHPNHAVHVSPEVELPEETTISVEALLSEGGTVKGRLVDDLGDALTGNVRIVYLNGEELPWARTDEIPSAKTDSLGRFELSRIPNGEHEVLLEPLGFGSRQLAVEVPADERSVELGDIRFATDLKIEGFVVDGSGEGVAGVDISAVMENGFVANVLQGNPQTARAVSNEHGSFTIAGLDEGSYRLMASQGGGAESVVAAGTVDVELRVVSASAVHGRVVDREGTPIPSFSVALHERFPDGRTSGVEQQFNDAAGEFRIEGLTSQSYTVTASTPGLRPTTLTRVEIKGFGAHDLGDIVLQQGASIHGRVTDGNGNTIPGVTLTTYPEVPGGPTVTDSEGRFSFEGFLDGVVDVRASHPDYAQAAIKDLEVRIGQSPAEVEIRLGTGGRLQGHVLDRSGRGIENRLVRVQSLQDSRSQTQFRTGPNGEFEFDRLAVGTHRVELLSGEERLRIPLQEKEVRIEDGQTTVLEFESSTIRIFGQARKGGMALVGVQISFRPEGATGGFYASGVRSQDPFPLLGLTDTDGSYELWVDHPGDYTVEATMSNGDTRFPPTDVFVPDTNSHVVDLTFDSVSVSGTVTSQQDDKPLQQASVWAYPARSAATAVPVSTTRTNALGEFRLELDRGSYRLRVAATGHAPKEQPLEVDDFPARLVISLADGLEIIGRVVDASGESPGRFYLHVVEDAGPPNDPPRFSQWGDIHPDGTFELRDLADARYNVLAGSDILGFAFAPGLSPGDRPLLRLRPAGWIDVLVRDTQGIPSVGARVAVVAIAGRKVRGVFGRTDDEGKAELYAPTGDLVVKAVSLDGQQGSQRVAVSESGRASIEIRLDARSQR